MYPNWNLFSIYEKVFKGVLATNNKTTCLIAGIRRVRLKMLNVMVSILAAVRHIPNLKKNPISLTTLNSKECKFIAE